jgi:hypothetical protein
VIEKYTVNQQRTQPNTRSNLSSKAGAHKPAAQRNATTAKPKPAAKAFGDKFESAKKFNAQAKPNVKPTVGTTKGNGAKRPATKPFSAPKK